MRVLYALALLCFSGICYGSEPVEDSSLCAQCAAATDALPLWKDPARTLSVNLAHARLKAGEPIGDEILYFTIPTKDMEETHWVRTVDANGRGVHTRHTPGQSKIDELFRAAGKVFIEGKYVPRGLVIDAFSDSSDDKTPNIPQNEDGSGPDIAFYPPCHQWINVERGISHVVIIRISKSSPRITMWDNIIHTMIIDDSPAVTCLEIRLPEATSAIENIVVNCPDATWVCIDVHDAPKVSRMSLIHCTNLQQLAVVKKESSTIHHPCVPKDTKIKYE